MFRSVDPEADRLLKISLFRGSFKSDKQLSATAICAAIVGGNRAFEAERWDSINPTPRFEVQSWSPACYYPWIAGGPSHAEIASGRCRHGHGLFRAKCICWE